MKRTLAVGVVAVAVTAGAASGWALTGHSSAASTAGQWSLVSAQSAISPVTFGGQAGARQNKNPADAIAHLQGASPADPAVDSVDTTVAGGNITLRLHMNHLDQGTTFSGGARYMSVWLNLLIRDNEQVGVLSLTNNPGDPQADTPVFTCGEVKPSLFPKYPVAGGFDFTKDTATFSVPESLLTASCPIVNKQVTVDGDVMLYDWWNKTTGSALFDSGVWKSHIHGPVLHAPSAVSAPSSSTGSAGGGAVSAPNGLQIKYAEAIARNQASQYGRHITAGAAYVTQGTQTNGNIGPDCASGTLLNIVLLGSFPHDEVSGLPPIPGQPARDLTVRGIAITADGQTGKPCLFGDLTGHPNLHPDWTRINVN